MIWYNALAISPAHPNDFTDKQAETLFSKLEGYHAGGLSADPEGASVRISLQADSMAAAETEARAAITAAFLAAGLPAVSTVKVQTEHDFLRENFPEDFPA